MYENLSEEQAFDLEREFIKRYGRVDLGCGTLVNMTNGGEGETGRIFSKDHRRKMSIAKLGNQTMLGYKHTEESKMKQSLSHMGHDVSESTRQKLRKPKSDTARENMSRPRTEQHKKNVSIAIQNWWKKRKQNEVN
jgi:hypothetical protein